MAIKTLDIPINYKGELRVDLRTLELKEYYRSMNVWKRRAKGFFMEMRILPVLVWTFTAILIGAAIAYQEIGEINWLLFLLSLLIAANAQSFPTHIVNELVDWKSGTDEHGFGGSKVLKYEILTQKEMILLFWSSIGAHVILSFITAILAGNWFVLVFYYAGLIAGITYTLPPFSFAYKPFLGEWLGGFAGVFIAVTGAYFTQALTLSWLSIFTAIGVSLVCVGIMIMFHTMDYEADKNSNPQKRTTVVFLGQENARNYVLTCVVIAILFFIFASSINLYVLILSFFGVAELFYFAKYDPFSAKSIINQSKPITKLHILAGVVFATVVNIIFILVAIIPILGFIAHSKFGKLKRLESK